tara:strand:- start:33 stop:428 length:396 start_codon:yes stop_codon:yes gene_type:complete
LNNSKIQKIIFIYLTFLNIFIPSGNAHPLNLEKSSIINRKNRFNEQNDFINSKIYQKNQLLTNLESVGNNSDHTKTKTVDKKINTVVNELYIESKLQSEKDNILNAIGDVVVKFKENILKADRLTYNKKLN